MCCASARKFSFHSGRTRRSIRQRLRWQRKLRSLHNNPHRQKNIPSRPEISWREFLREQLGLSDDKKLALYFSLTKDLNPQRKNWDLLQAGDVIRLPAIEEASAVRKVAGSAAAEQKAAPATSQLPAVTEAAKTTDPKIAPVPMAAADYGKEVARENFGLITEIIESVGNEVERSGEEIVAIQDGSLKLNRASFPVVTNSKLGQKVLLDPEAKVPDSVKSQLGERPNGISVMAIGKSNSVTQLAGQVLSRLGFQSLRGDQAVVIQEGGVAFEAKGQWVVLGPEENNKPQQVYVINVADKTGAVPGYLKSYLALKGLHLREIVWPPASAPNVAQNEAADKSWFSGAKSTLPRDKREMVDALLRSYGIAFQTRVPLTWELGAGLTIETSSDRVFEWGGRQTAVFFQRVGADLKKSLQEKQSIKTVDLDLSSLSSREILAKLLTELGEQTSYAEQRFPATGGNLRDRLTVVTAGFALPKKSVLITDRDIPLEFQRFFFEKGWEIVYFQ